MRRARAASCSVARATDFVLGMAGVYTAWQVGLDAVACRKSRGVKAHPVPLAHCGWGLLARACRQSPIGGDATHGDRRMRAPRILRSILVAGTVAAVSLMTIATTVLGVTTGGGFPR